jgi:hypothetical protein
VTHSSGTNEARDAHLHQSSTSRASATRPPMRGGTRSNAAASAISALSS